MAANGAAGQDEVLSRIFASLRSEKASERRKASAELRKYVKQVPAEDRLDPNSAFNSAFNTRMLSIAHTPVVHEKLGGIAAIEQLVDVDMGGGDASKRYLYRLYQLLRYNLPTNNAQVMAEASKALGMIVKVAGPAFTDQFMEMETDRALDLLNDRDENGRYAAVCIIRELAFSVPNLLYPYVSRILDHRIWAALRDTKLQVREGAAAALGACLDILRSRSKLRRSDLFDSIWREASEGLTVKMLSGPSSETIHGSLLAVQQLRFHSGTFMREHLAEACDAIIPLHHSRDAQIRNTVSILIPQLAQYDPASFETRLDTVVNALVDHLRNSKNNGQIWEQTFRAIGLLASAMGGRMRDHLRTIASCLKEGFLLQGKKNAPDAKYMFDCIGKLADAVGPALGTYADELVKLMFSCRLTQDLVKSVERLRDATGVIHRLVQERMLDKISLSLTGRPFRCLGQRAQAEMISKNGRSDDNGEAETIVVALRTLGTFDFGDEVLIHFVRASALPYLDNDNVEVVKAAATSCARRVSEDPICHHFSIHAIELVNDVLDRLISVAVADADSTVRYHVLKVLHDLQHFHRHLAQEEHVQSLSIALNDESYNVRLISVGIMGQLSREIPAFAVPPLRKTLIQLLIEAEYANTTRKQKEAVKLLTELLNSAPALAKPYAVPMLHVLLSKAKHEDQRLTARVIECLGQLAKVGGEDLSGSINDLLALTTEQLGTTVGPNNIVKRNAALRTLGLVVSNCGFKENPYLQYRSLLGNLIRILRTEQGAEVRRETMRVMGILGALDPFRYKLVDASAGEEESKQGVEGAPDLFELALAAGPASEEYFQNVAVEALMAVLRDRTLTAHHYLAIEGVTYMFTTQGLKCVNFLPQIIPTILGVIRHSSTIAVESYYSKLTQLVNVIQQHVRNYVPDILDLIKEKWAATPNAQGPIASLVQALSRALGAEFKRFMPQLLPHLLDVLETESAWQRDSNVRRILETLGVLGADLEEYLQLILPPIIAIAEHPDAVIKLRISAIQTLGTLARRLKLSNHASKIIQPLLRCLKTGPPELRRPVLDTITIIGVRLGGPFVIFVPVATKVVFELGIQHERFERLVAKVVNGEPIPINLTGPDPLAATKAPESLVAEPQQMQVNQQHLAQSWNTVTVYTAEDWSHWLRRIAVEFLRESPSHALRACRTLAENYEPIALELFNAAFMACYRCLHEDLRASLIASIENALHAPDIPDSVVNALLNLAEFAEHDSENALIQVSVLGDCASKYGSYAKALHYKETEYMQHPSESDRLEALIDINTKLQDADAALGVLNLAQQEHRMNLRQEWYEKLSRWEDALHGYDARLLVRPDSWTANFGRMRCLHALGEWEQLAELVQERWHHPNVRTQHLSDMAPLAAAAAWSLGQWEIMDKFIDAMDSESSERPFYRALGHVHGAETEKAQKQINRARDHLDTELSSALNEGYGRAYSLIVRTQMLSELEEALAYKTTFRDQRDRQASIRALWMKRLDKCQPEVDVWQRILSVRSIVLTPEDDIDSWIKFANLCRKSGRMRLAEKTINSLLGTDMRSQRQPGEHAPPPVIYSHLKFSWAHGLKKESLVFLRQFTKNLASDLGLAPREEGTPSLDDWRPPVVQQKDARLLARCYFKQADWQIALNENWVTDENCDVIWSFWRATQLDRNWYKPWHAWALANFEVITYQGRHGGAKELMEISIVPAIEGFFRSIALAEGSSLQDTLRILTLWFSFGDRINVNEALREGMKTISVDTWLAVIPQIVARFGNPSERVRALIHVLMCELGKAHPQALVYALGVASKSPVPLRAKVADDILQEIREVFPKLVEQTEIVTKELIRIAILWNEMWSEALTDVLRNPSAQMLAIILPLQELLERGAETLREQAFLQQYGRDLADAWECALRFQHYGQMADFQQAQEIYRDVYKKIQKQLPVNSPQLDLQTCSPRLLDAADLELAVPGTYEVGKPLVTIRNFEPTVMVMSSKQRPRRLKLRGSDGKTYQYLLKGHEDTRQDERVMQLFGLFNTLLSTDAECYKRRLDIRRYAIIPLSPNAGMIFWVEDTDTMHMLIKRYREKEKILLNLEHRLMLQMAPDYENLILLQKIEVFQYALDNTTGSDLYRIMWLKSRNSEIWLQRRTTYTRSIATASMTGYILGLGDRHPSNLLFHRLTGQIVNIDFGDCFELASLRPMYPERVPFRLTRMLVVAMGVGGLKGAFKITSEHVMRVMRDNKESVLALLEAFVHDPLITWKMLAVDADQPQMEETSEYVRAATGEQNVQQDRAQMSRAVEILKRLESKLKGRDFDADAELSVAEQVAKLVEEATSLHNLAPAFVGWCSFW
ncbi:phosphatidylinositol kinase- protein kinase tor1 [Tilletia horrida]|uniref:Serine/threonine-protein kinase TOR n=1 Tax=Tilletia horrida TaxID=155126 RepID=A0AAN6JLI9_9BASI|nr:phosphatidylinositol kinase- protein kinase tor1 [Tilletia horrida]